MQHLVLGRLSCLPFSFELPTFVFHWKKFSARKNTNFRTMELTSNNIIYSTILGCLQDPEARLGEEKTLAREKYGIQSQPANDSGLNFGSFHLQQFFNLSVYGKEKDGKSAFMVFEEIIKVAKRNISKALDKLKLCSETRIHIVPCHN